MFKTKQEYRKWAKNVRKKLDIQHISNLICEKIRDLCEYKTAVNIAGFYPADSETDLRPLFSDTAKNWFLPVVVDNENMIFRKDNGKEDFVPNKFGIYEPTSGKELNISDLDMIIIPALMTDKAGHRLGYGKGYYDRFLAKLPNSCIKLVPIAEELVIDDLPYDKYDIPIDIAVTQNAVCHYK